jgi:hypothetical protein
MHFVYIDESKDESYCVYSALAIPVDKWHEHLSKVQEFRRGLKKSDGIYVKAELHAWKFVSGRGRISASHVSRQRRCEIFRETLEFITTLEGVKLFNAFSPRSQELEAFQYLVTRVDRTMLEWNSRALLICDSGNEGTLRKLVRKMRRYNPIPSQYGCWEDGRITKNFPLTHIVEDPFFHRSEDSYFIQLVDFCAYALLRTENPTIKSQQCRISEAFKALEPILVLEASRKDPLGIIRLTHRAEQQ